MFVTKQPWMDQSLCRNENLTIFFPSRYTENNVAKPFSICKNCPVKIQCLQYAYSTDSMGIWSSTTEYQRNIILVNYVKKKSRKITLSDAKKIIDNNYYSVSINSKNLDLY